MEKTNMFWKIRIDRDWYTYRTISIIDLCTKMIVSAEVFRDITIRSCLEVIDTAVEAYGIPYVLYPGDEQVCGNEMVKHYCREHGIVLYSAAPWKCDFENEYERHRSSLIKQKPDKTRNDPRHNHCAAGR